MPADDERRRNTFRSECDAYGLVAQNSFLTAHTPEFFGANVVSDVRDAAGNSVLAHYLPEHCYAMEYVEGTPIKLGHIPFDERPEHIKAALQAFHAAGVHHLTDVSIFSALDAENFIFIDFATEEFEAVW